MLLLKLMNLDRNYYKFISIYYKIMKNSGTNLRKCNSCKTFKKIDDFFNGIMIRKTCDRCRRGNKMRPFRDIIKLQIYERRCWCWKY